MKKVLFLTLAISCQFLFAQNIIYVNHAATGADDGSSWADAYNDLQDALDSTLEADQIWVAKGTYYPTRHGMGRDVAFYLWQDSVMMFGGFLGGETALTQRNWKANKTLLSGDIGVKGDSSDNCHIVFIFNASKGSLIDGFVVSNGGESAHAFASAVLVGTSSKVVLKNLHITRNHGIGLANSDFAHFSMINCRIDSNNRFVSAGRRALSIGPGQVTITNCQIGPNNPVSHLHLYDYQRSEVFARKGSFFTITNSTIIDGYNSWAMYMDLGSKVQIFNSIITDSIVRKAPLNGSIVMQNCLARYSGAGSLNWGGQSVVDLGGNIDTVPLFVGGEDYRLSHNSPAINAGLNDSVPMDNFDMDNDGIINELLPIDLNGTMRVVDGRVDIGAYEYIPAWADTTYQTICNGDSIAFDSTYYAMGGVYKQSYAPDSAQYFSLSIDTPNTDVQVWFGGILEAKADSVSYRWIDCNDTTIDFGITEKTFYPAQAGNYAVIITTPNGCVDTSACYQVNNISLSQTSLSNKISLYPNPTSGLLHVVFPEEMTGKSTVVNVLDVNGKIILRKEMDSKEEKEITLHVEQLSKGIYFLKIEGQVLRFVKE